MSKQKISHRIQGRMVEKTRVAWEWRQSGGGAVGATGAPIPIETKLSVTTEAMLEAFDELEERIAASTAVEPKPSDLPQATKTLSVMCAWAERGFGFDGPFKRYTEDPLRQFGCSFTWHFAQNPPTEEVVYGATPYDAICQATTVMKVLLDEHQP